MKKLLFLLLLVPTLCHAQQYEASFGVGISHNKGASVVSSSDVSNTVNPAFQIEIRRKISHFRYGIGLDYLQLKYKATVHLFDTNGNPLGSEKETMKIASPAYGIHLLCNYQQSVKIMDIYGGVKVGYLTGTGLADNGANMSVSSVFYGIQLGAEKKISAVHLFLEFDYNSSQLKNLNESTTNFYLVLAGVRIGV